MTIEYVAANDCLKLRFKDAFTYVRSECEECGLIEALWVAVIGKTVRAAVALEYVLRNRESTLGKRLNTALASRSIKSTANDTTPPSGSHHQNNTDKLMTSTNQPAKDSYTIFTDCHMLDTKKTNLEINKQEKRIDELNDKITNIKADTDVIYQNNVKLDHDNMSLKKKIDDEKEVVSNTIDRLTNIGVSKEDNSNKINDYIGNEVSELYSDWKNLHSEISENYKLSNENAANELLIILESGKLGAKNIIIKEQLILFTNGNPKTVSRNKLWENKVKTMTDDLMNSKDNGLTQQIEKFADDIISEGNKDHTPKHLKPYLKKIIRVSLLMALQPSPMVFLHVNKNDVFNENEFTKFDNELKSKRSKVDFMIFPAVVTKKNGILISKGIVKTK